MQRSTVIALGVFAILLVAAGWVLTRKPERGIQRINFSGLQAGLIDRISVTGAHPIELTKDGTAWHLANGREADGDAVQNLLANGLKVVSADVLAQDANHSLDYDVDADKGEHVQLFSLGTVMADFIVGKSMAGGAAVRAGDLVFRVPNLPVTAFAHSPTDWTQRRMFTEKPDDVSRINVRLAGREPYTLVRTDQAWELANAGANVNARARANGSADPSADAGAKAGTHAGAGSSAAVSVDAAPDFRFDPGAAQALAAALVGLRANEILDSDPGVEVTKLGPEADALTFFPRDPAGAQQAADRETGAGTGRTLLLGASREDKSLYARVEGRKEVVLLPSYAALALRKERTDLRDLTIMLPFDVNQVQALTVNSGKKAVTFSKDVKDGSWHLPRGEKTPAGFQLDPAKVMRRLQTVAHARALGLAKEQGLKATGLAPAQASIALNIGGSTTVSVGFGSQASEQDNAVYVLGMDRKVYYLAKYLRDTLLGGLETFNKDAQQADPLTQLDPKTLEGLPPDVRASLEQQIAAKRREQEMMRTLHAGQAAHP